MPTRESVNPDNAGSSQTAASSTLVTSGLRPISAKDLSPTLRAKNTDLKATQHAANESLRASKSEEESDDFSKTPKIESTVAAPQNPLPLRKPVYRRRVVPPSSAPKTAVRLMQFTGVFLSAFWLTGAALYVQKTVGWQNVSGLMPHEMGGFLAGILTPIALFWMIAAFIVRSIDVKMYAEALREEIQAMIFPSEEADRKVNNDIERLMRQTEQMTKATRSVLQALDASREALKGQVQSLNGSGEQTMDRLSRLSQSLQERMRDVTTIGEQLDSTFKHLEVRAHSGAKAWQTVVSEVSQKADGLSQSVQRVTDTMAGAVNTMISASDQVIDKHENHIQSAVTRLSAANDHIARHTDLIDQSTGKTEEAVARLSGLLRERLEALGSLHHETQHALETSVAEMAKQREALREEANDVEAQAMTVASALTKATERLYGFTDEALDKSKLIETRLQGQATSLETIVGQALESAEMIETTTEKAAARLAGVTHQSVTDAKALEAILNGTADRLENSVNQALAQTQGTLTELDKQSAAIIAAIANNTQEQTTAALVRLDSHREQHTGEIKSLITKHESIMTQTAQALQKTTQLLTEQTQQQLNATIHTMQNRAENLVAQIQSSLSGSTENLIANIDQLSGRAKDLTHDMLNDVNQKVGDTTAAFAYIQKQIQSLVGLFDSRKNDLEIASGSARDTANTLQATLQAALDKVHSTTEALQSGISHIHKAVQQPITLLEKAAEKANQEALVIGGVMEKGAETLYKTAEMIVGQTHDLHAQLEQKGQTVAFLAGKVTADVKTATQTLDTSTAHLTDRVNTGLRAITDLNEAMTAQTHRVTDVSGKALDALSAIENRVLMGMKTLREQTEATSDQGNTLAKLLMTHVNELQQSHQVLTDDMMKSEQRFAQVSDRLVHISTNTVTTIKDTIENFTLLEADYHRLAESGIEQIQTIEKSYRNTLDTVRDGTQQLADQANQINQSAEEARGALDSSAQQLRNMGVDVSLVTDQAILKINKVQEVGQALSLSLQQVSSAADAFDARSVQSGQLIQTHIKQLGDAGQKIGQQASDVADMITMQGRTLEQFSATHLDRLTKTGAIVAQQSDAIKSTVANSVESAGAFAERLRDYLTQLRQDTSTVEQSLAQSVSQIVTHSDKIDLSTTRLMDKINKAHVNLVSQSQSITTGGDELLQRLEAATHTIQERAFMLERAAQLAQQQAEALRSQESRLKREAFFSSTKFVVESLHSLALDFTRLLDGELPEKTWKSYQKGDLSAFTRRMLSARDEQTQEKIKNKYKEDVEFRTYTQRYLRQFEEIYDQAANNDHADLLANVFLSSDVGKLYGFLCTVLERDKRGSETLAVAA